MSQTRREHGANTARGPYSAPVRMHTLGDMGHGAVLSGVTLLSLVALGGETVRGVPHTNVPDTSGSGSIEVRGAGPDGFTIQLSFNPPYDLGIERDGCLFPALAPVVGEVAAPGGQSEHAWLIGMPDADPPTVELLVVRTEQLDARPLCQSAPQLAGRTDRLLRDLSLQDLTPRSLDRLEAAAFEKLDVPTVSDPVVEIACVGSFRDQPVGRMVVRPVAAGDAGLLVVRTRIRARVRYPDPDHVVRAPALDGPFAALKSQLLNREFVPRRVTEGIGPGHEGSGSGQATSSAAKTTQPHRASSHREAELDSDLPALKIEVEHDGPVVVTGSQLVEAGWDLAQIDPRTLSLQCGGKAWAMQIDSRRDGALEPEDGLLFEGRAMTGPYTRTNVYWLLPDGEAPRVGSRSAIPGMEPIAQSFVARRHFEEDTRLIWSMTPDQANDRWMWGDAIAAATRLTRTLRLGVVAAEPSQARLRLALHGYTDDRAVDPDHHVRIWWNGMAIHDQRFDGLGLRLVDAILPAGAVTTGENELAIESVGDTSALVDTLYLNWLDLEHEAAFVAAGDHLSFVAPGAGRFRFELRGFLNRDVRVWDVTEASRPVTLSGVDVSSDGASGYRATFTDTAKARTRYVAFSPIGASPPDRVVADVASELRSGTNGADYILITHPTLAEAVAPLVARRLAQGLRVRTVLVDDIYDEFAHGVFDPRAIRAFLRYASEHWAPPAPTYVLLVGEANLDYRGGYGAGPPNLVPSMQVEHAGGNQLTMFTSDQWFGMLHDGDTLPGLFIGRISASTQAQVSAVVDKTLRFEDAPTGRTWQRTVVLVADDNGAVEFEGASERLAAVIPPDGHAERIYAGGYPLDRDISADIRTAIDDGAFALNFFGHGNVSLWSPWPGGGRIFENDDIRDLRNGSRMPVFTSGTCMNGWIDHPLKPVSMTEQWLIHPDGGGVAAWAASGFTQTGAVAMLLEYAYRGMYDGSAMPIGALTAAAGAQLMAYAPTYAHAYSMYTLLGDPALVVSGAPSSATPVRVPTADSALLPRVVR